MDFGDNDTQKMLMLYIHDHMKKNNMHDAAKVFAQEANLELKPVIDAPEGFLAEWWGVFWNIYFSIYSNLPGSEEATRDTSTLDKSSFVLPTPESFQEATTRTMLQNVSPIVTSLGTLSQQLVSNSSHSHCNDKLDTVMEPSATILVPTPGVNRIWFETTMPNVGSSSHQLQKTCMQSSLQVAGVGSNQNFQGRSSSHMEPNLQPGLNSPSTGSRNPNAGAFDFFKYYFRD
ncbi:hypothetical protein POM88_025475 [Heracleum sosnowskyi]|uniref:LisH domain-containing protein n=1 Tax=Heracleum sosnowskyi TaxID=360622 RepID=A0AAD8I536_9APIA|nr:hypothetical protein POM88_025475 [Heracleum sosnowskyi]